MDPDPWIRIFLRIWIQEVKILRIQRIRILSTGLEYDLVNTRRGSAMVQCCSQENDFRDDYTENI